MPRQCDVESEFKPKADCSVCDEPTEVVRECGICHAPLCPDCVCGHPVHKFVCPEHEVKEEK